MSALRALAALDEAGSMTRAGAMLNVTHAAIGQQIRALEDRLGVTLVVRTGRTASLTPEGQALAAVLRQAFGSMAEAVEEISGLSEARPVQVSTTPTFAAQWLMPRLGDFGARHPEIGLMVNPTPQLVALEPGGIDVAIRFGAGGWSGLDCRLLMPSRIGVVAAKSLLGDHIPRTAAEMLDLPWLQEVGTNEVAEWLARQGIVAGRMRRLTQLPGNFVLEGVRRGQGVAATTLDFVEEDIASGDLVLLAQDERPGVGYYVVTRPGVLRPAARAFVAWLRTQV